MSCHKFYRRMNAFYNNVFDYSFVVISIFSLLFLVLLIVLTFIDLYRLYGFSMELSKEGVIRFLVAFNWCIDYIVACFMIFPIYGALGTYRIHKANKEKNDKNDFSNNTLKPLFDKFNSNLFTIQEDNIYHNKRMFQEITSLGEQIIEEIMEDRERIQSKKRLQFFFNKYIQQYVSVFEECGYWCKDYCKGTNVCSGPKCEKNPILSYNIKDSHSFDSFQKIARELFCISTKYDDFEKHIKEIYMENVDKLKKVNTT